MERGMESAVNGRKGAAGEVGIQLPEAKLEAADTGTMSGPLMPPARRAPCCSGNGRRWDAVCAGLRAACAVTSLLSLCLMVTAEQHADLSLYGFQLPLYSKWSFSNSLEYLVGMSAAVAAHSLLQLLLSVRKLVKRAPVIPSRSHAWIMFAGDQAFAYAMMSAGSAAAGVTNLNRTGIRHAALPDFCKPLRRFCDRMAISIAFAFLSCLFLAMSTILEVLWLSNY